MAANLSRWTYLALRQTSRIPSRKPILRISSQRHPRLPPSVARCLFHTSPLYRAEDDLDDGDDSALSEPTRTAFRFRVTDLDDEERAAYQALSPEEQEQWRDEAKQIHDYMTSPETEQELAGDVAQAVNEAAQETPHEEFDIPRIKPGLLAMGEDEEQDIGEDEEFEGDDITSLGHGELEQHREMREYARIMAWEMPMLSKLAKPFTPPNLQQPLRFRYTTYMGEDHPAQKKIVLEFCTRDLRSLTEAQRIKLIKLVGPRYNPETDIVKMSSEMFETQAQNKRYLGDLVDTLMAEAKDESDMFEDVPLDFRHHKFKRKVEFPDEWKLNKRRRDELKEERERRVIEDRRKEEEGKMIDGASIIAEAMKRLPVRDESRVLVEAQQGKRGKGGARKGKTRQLR